MSYCAAAKIRAFKMWEEKVVSILAVGFFCWNISFIYIELVNKQNHSKNAHVGVRNEGDRETIRKGKKSWISEKEQKPTENL